MNAQELSKKYIELSNKVIDLENDNKYLNDEINKLRLLLNDIKIDIDMLRRA